MRRSSSYAFTGLAAGLALAGIAYSQSGKDPKATKPAGQTQQAPAGMSEADMKACMEAGTPGKMHARLAETIGTWTGTTSMWMAPGTEPTKSECTAVYSAAMDGRFTKVEVLGDMPGMGPFNGFGLYGYDNVAQKFQSCWIDNCGTGIMNGTGAASADGKEFTWNYSYNCPITKKPTVLRQVERHTSKDAFTLEMFGADPHSGKEFKMMEIAYARKAGGATAVPANVSR